MDKYTFFTPDLKLTIEQVNQLTDMLTVRCKKETKFQVKAAIRFNWNYCFKSPLFTRFYLQDGNVHYCAGQCYTSEMTYVRNFLKQNKL